MTNNTPLPHKSGGNPDQTSNVLTKNVKRECHQGETAGGFTVQQRANKRPTGKGAGKPVTFTNSKRNSGAYTPEVWPWSQDSGDKARLALLDGSVYPTRCLIDDPGHDFYENRAREILPSMLELLDRNDLAAVFELVKVLSASVGKEIIFEISKLKTERFLASMGREPNGSKCKV